MQYGYVDYASRYGVVGWACDDAQPGAPLRLLVLHNDVLVARVLANLYRRDLEEAGFGGGRHGFQLEFPTVLPANERHVVRVCREADGTDLARSPMILEAPNRWSGTARELLAEMLAGDLPDEELASSIDFMIKHLDTAMQRLAERQSGSAVRKEYRLFLDRWRRRVSCRDASWEAVQSDMPSPRALIIDDQLPQPERDAGSVAIVSHIRSFQRLGFEVSFAAALEFASAGGDRACLEALGVACCCAPYYGSVEEVLRRQAGSFDVIYLHRVANAARYGELARHYCPNAQQIYGVADLHHVRIGRQASAEDRPELADVANRLRLLEFASAALADAVITHSSEEAEILASQVGGAKVHTLRWSVTPRPTKVPFGRRSGIAFIGWYGHPPNRDAAHWLISEIMPLVRRRAPSMECLLVGGDFPDMPSEAANNGLRATGRVEDLAEIFNRVRVTVAPLRYGAGIKGKVIDSLAAGVPCVMTPIAAEGLDLPTPLQACVGATAAEIAEAIVHLHDDKRANEACRKAGLHYVVSAFGEPHLDAAIRKVVDHRP